MAYDQATAVHETDSSDKHFFSLKFFEQKSLLNLFTIFYVNLQTSKTFY